MDIKNSQNFLTSKSLVEEIVNKAHFTHNLSILEIGAGKGIITDELLKKYAVTALELDNALYNDLKKKYDGKNVELVKTAITKQGKTKIIVLFEVGFAFVVAFLVFISMALSRMDKLFVNIHDGETPFTLDNVNYLKKMAYFMITAIVLSAVGSTILNIGLGAEDVIEFNIFNITEIIFLFAMSLIFEYGYRIQQDSKGKMYDAK